MPTISAPKINIVNQTHNKVYQRVCVSCIILSKDGKFVLQLRDKDSLTFPGRLAAFGGGIEENEPPMLALIRELREELGADVHPREVIPLGALTEADTNYNELVYVYFWHDKWGSITGCYEGTATYFSHADEAEKHPQIMQDVKWLLKECKKRKLIF